MIKIAIFASGGGSNFQALIDRIESKELDAEIRILIVNNSKAGAVERAKKHNIPYIHCAPSHFPNEEKYVEKLFSILKEYSVELIVLAGYMKKIPTEVVKAFPNRIINIHPALLPAFGGKGMYGEKVHQAVLEYGAKITGITVHFVDEEYDHGPIILQRAIPVLDDDTVETLSKRVLAIEHDSLWRVVEAIDKGKIRVEGRRVFGNVLP